MVLLDGRVPAEFTAGHVRGAISIGLQGRFEECRRDARRGHGSAGILVRRFNGHGHSRQIPNVCSSIAGATLARRTMHGSPRLGVLRR
jgi:hypothetical protein